MSIFWRKLFRRCLQTGIVGLFLAVLLLVTGQEDFQPIMLFFGFFLGFFVGFIELYVLRRVKFGHVSLLLITRITLYGIVSVGSIVLFSYLFGKVSFFQIIEEATAMQVVAFATETLAICTVIALFLQVQTFVGIRVFSRYLFGRYVKPREEKRFFMFIDINDSTKIAEKLGNKEYYVFLNAFFRDLSNPLFKADAEIYKYIGDEVIISWPVKKGLDDNNILRIFFDLKTHIHDHRQTYINRFGIFPTFKASCHIGIAMVAQIGDLKKEIAYNGDVVNTTARIIAQCKRLDARFLISEDVYLRLENMLEYEFELKPQVMVEGKKLPLNLYSVKQKKSR
jgi:adenylate cyclase